MGGHDCPRGSGLYAPGGDFILYSLVHKGRSQSGGDMGDRSVLCWQQYNFPLEDVVRKTMHPRSSCTGRSVVPQEKRQSCLWRCLPPSEITRSPQHAWTQYPQQGPHKDDHTRLENSPSRPTMEHCSLLFSKGKETNRKETPTWKHDLTSRPWGTQLSFPTSAASETLSWQQREGSPAPPKRPRLRSSAQSRLGFWE